MGNVKSLTIEQNYLERHNGVLRSKVGKEQDEGKEGHNVVRGLRRGTANQINNASPWCHHSSLTPAELKTKPFNRSTAKQEEPSYSS